MMLLILTYNKSAFDAVVLGRFVDGKLVYVARTRSGFTPSSRAELLRKMKPLEVPDCPFVNLPEMRPGRWGEGLTADKMKECRWLARRRWSRALSFWSGPPTGFPLHTAPLLELTYPVANIDEFAVRHRTLRD